MRNYNLLEHVPMIIFISLVSYFGKTEAVLFDILDVSGFIGTIISVVMYYRKKQRKSGVSVGFTVFFIIGMLAHMGNINFIMNYYYAYTGVIMFSCIAAVGLIATLFSSREFIWIESSDKKKVRVASLQLLGICVLSGLFSLLMQFYDYHVFFSLILPCIVLVLISDKLRNRVITK